MKKRILSLALALVMLLSLMPMSAMADGATSGTYTSDSGVTYTLEDGTMTVSGEGECTGVYYRFDESAVTKVVIEEGVTGIMWQAFYGNKYITSVTIPDSVTYIGNHAFMNCTNLTDVTVGNGITELGYGTFFNTGYYRDKSNWEDGLLYLGGWLIHSDMYQETHVIKEGTKGIAPFSFNGTDGMASVYIPDSVKTIGLAAFQQCAKLADVYYGGTEEQWAKIDIDSNNYGIDYSMLHFSSTVHEPDCISIVTAPTCTEKGYTTRFCSCGAVKVSAYVDALGHDFRDGICTHCGGADNSYTDDNGIIYTLDNNTLTVSGEGECGNAWKDYFDVTAVKEVVVAGSVTSIGEIAFSNCGSLTSVTIGDSVTSIDYWAFGDCNVLTSVTIGDSVISIDKSAFYNTAYYNDEANWENNVLYIDGCLIEAESDLSGDYSIKDGTRLIADDAFNGCSSLTSVTIPDSVTSIGKFTFYNCSALVSVTIPDSVTSIGKFAFYNCSALVSVTIPDSVTSIGDYAFSGCSALTSLSISDSVTSIGESAFYNCSSLTSLVIPDSVTEIGHQAFYGCSALASVTIPDSVTSIGYSVFDRTACYYDDSNWDNSVLYISNCLIKVRDYKSGDCNIKDGTRVVASEAFFGCDSLTSISIPDSVTNIDCRAFNGCSFSEINVSAENSSYSSADGVLYNKAQTELVRYPTAKSGSFSIPDGVTGIGDHAFRGQQLLTSIAIPNTMINIGESAFVLCNSLADVYYDGTQEQWSAISIDAGNDCLTNATIYYNGEIHTHSYTDVVTVPTCTEQGYTTHTCSCGERYVDSYVDALDHNYTDTVTAPTCTERGYTLHTCECGSVKADTFVDALGHDYKDGACTVCGEEDPNYKELLPGDLNGDGKVNVLDLIRLKKHLAGANVELVGSADVNGDGKVNVLDLIRLKKYLAGANVELVSSTAKVR